MEQQIVLPDEYKLRPGCHFRNPSLSYEDVELYEEYPIQIYNRYCSGISTAIICTEKNLFMDICIPGSFVKLGNRYKIKLSLENIWVHYGYTNTTLL